MKKSYPFNELSNKRCIECGKPLKRRIAEEKPSAGRCYRCHSTRLMKERNREAAEKQREKTERRETLNG